MSINKQYIYLLQEREFIKTGELIYKIGRTIQPLKRMAAYPKDSDILLITVCTNCIIYEALIIQKFKESYKQRKDIGTEYFEGNYIRMIDDINTLIKLPIGIAIKEIPDIKSPISNIEAIDMKSPTIDFLFTHHMKVLFFIDFVLFVMLIDKFYN